ncbi:MAG: YwiC-like family protein [Candidatus Hydrogenedentes bacterium]|nr:YwiC-like family protein [Candidatus Hydrogenedentota bacterium]
MARQEPFWQRIRHKYYAVPPEHGAWIWWIGPFAIGAAAGQTLSVDLLMLAATALAAYLLRQPMTMTVKVLSGRRGRGDLAPSVFWAWVYSVTIAAGVVGLVWLGHVRILILALPGVPVFAFHLWLVSRKEERGQLGIELVASGVLALTAPAAYWVCDGPYFGQASLLWCLTWLQSAASIRHVYLRLEQRQMKTPPDVKSRWKMGVIPLLYHTSGAVFSAILAATQLVPWLVPAAFLLTLADGLHSVAKPPVGYKPSRIGIRQLVISTAFAVLMIIAYHSR